MTKHIFLIIFSLIGFSNNAQSKKEQIKKLNYQVDSLFNSIDQLITKHEKASSILNEELTKAKINETALKYELEKLTNKLEQITIQSNRLSIDTIEARETHTCYYYISRFPHIVSSQFDDTTRKKVNNLIRQISFMIPSVMQNRDYKKFRNCERGDYNHTEASHEQHIIISHESWLQGHSMQSEFFATIEHIEHYKYFSLLMRVQYEAGGNWAHAGYNSLNLNNDEKIIIPTNPLVKKMLLSEINEFLIKNPFTDESGGNYPLVNEIQNWNIDDLTFYFKNDSLRLIFVNGDHGVFNQTFDIPLPKLQQYLNL